MFDRQFPICSSPVPNCIGREALLQRMARALTKGVPDHLQVIGPQFVGKTVLLAELTRRLVNGDSPYEAVLVWDMGHKAVRGEEEFIQAFGQQLASALRSCKPTYAEHLDLVGTISYGDIAEVLDALNDEGCKILAIWDRFEAAVTDNALSRNHWDQLRELASRPSLRLVVASRKRLSDLIRDPDTATSPFWNIFDPTPIQVVPFDNEDVDAVLQLAPKVSFSGGAKTELLNATNGSPLLLLEVFNTLLAQTPEGSINPEVMRQACGLTFSAVRDRIKLLWESCAVSSKDLFLRVREETSVPRNEATPADVDALVASGLIWASGNKLQRPNGLVCMYLDEQPGEDNALARLFGSPEMYERSLKSVLERRIAQLDGVDPQLRRYLQRGAEDLPDNPSVFLGSSVRGIVNRVFELIWDAETPGKRIPPEWMDIWKHNNERGIEDWETRFPAGGRRLRLLELLAGTDTSNRVAKYISRQACSMMKAVNEFGNFGNHQGDALVSAGSAYSILYLCIELVATITDELAR